MALDPLLFNTYKLYKAGTAKIIAWLVERAQETNVLIEPSPTASIPGDKGSSRLKGKARAAQKEASQKKSISLAHILRIVKSIASGTNLKVPESIIRTLEEVIAARSVCNDFFEQQGRMDTSAQATNQAHKHFIEVLRESHELLKPLCCASAQGSENREGTSDNKSTHRTSELRNRFEYLEVEDPAEWTSNALPPKSRSKSKSSSTAKSYELEPKDEDISFAIFCLLKDLTDIRHYVRQTWAEYREHQITFTTAAMTMNMAISVFRQLNEEFVSEFPAFDDHGEIIEYLSNGYCDPNSHDKNSPDFATYTGSGFKISSKIFFCDHTYEVLREFYMEEEVFLYQADQFSEYRLTDDEDILMKCLSLFSVIASRSQGNFFEDQLVKDLHLLKTNNPNDKIYTWVVFAVQLYVDTRRVIGNGLERCFQEARQIQQWMTKTLEQSLLFGNTNTINEFYKLNSDVFRQFKEEIDILLVDDCIETVLRDLFGDRADRCSWGPFFLFRNHPMLLGLITQQFLVRLHECGVSLAGDQGSVITSIHLYNSSHQSGEIPKGLEWIDLEKLIEWQGSSWVFLGDRPKNQQECLRHFSLVMGISATVFSRDRNGKSTFRLHKTAQRTGLKMSQNKNRNLRLMSTYVELMNEAPKARTRIGSIRWLPTRAATEPLVMLEMLVSKCLESNSEAAKKATTTPINNSSARPKVHPLSMISIFKDHLKSEEEIFRFDLLALNQHCVELLRKIQTRCLEESPLDYPLDKYDGDRSVNSCFRRMMAGEMGLERQQPTRFREACLLVKEVIERMGDKEYRNSRDRRFIKGDVNKRVTDTFSTPFSDVVLLSVRPNFSQIIVADGPPGSKFTII